MDQRICKKCGKDIPISFPLTFKHCSWDCANSRNFTAKTKQLLSTKTSSYYKSKRKDFQVSCRKCGKEFTVNEIISKHPQKQMYHCSRKCANTRIHSEETKKKIGKSNKIYAESHYPKYIYTCLFCKKECLTNSNLEKTKRKYCDAKCQKKHRDTFLNYRDYKNYKSRCYFKFKLSDYPNEFDLSLLEKYGFYHPKVNLQGISRDHIISVKYGFENKIDPKIMSHPANCKLMIHSENNKKKTRSDLTLEQLLHRIDEWNRKFRKNN